MNVNETGRQGACSSAPFAESNLFPLYHVRRKVVIENKLRKPPETIIRVIVFTFFMIIIGFLQRNVADARDSVGYVSDIRTADFTETGSCAPERCEPWLQPPAGARGVYLMLT